MTVILIVLLKINSPPKVNVSVEALELPLVFLPSPSISLVFYVTKARRCLWLIIRHDAAFPGKFVE